MKLTLERTFEMLVERIASYPSRPSRERPL
jgi:hypothetical protein